MANGQRPPAADRRGVRLIDGLPRLKHVFMAVAVAVLFACTQWELSTVRTLGNDNALLMGRLAEITRLEHDFLQLRLDATAFVHGDPVITGDQLRASFDLLAHRTDEQIARHPADGAGPFAAYQSALAGLARSLHQLEPLINNAQLHDRAVLDRIETILAFHALPTRRMNNAAYEELYQRARDTVVSQNAAMRGLDRLQWTLLIAGVAGILMLMRQIVQRDRLVGELQEREREIHLLATTDPLTGLPNRRDFDQRMQAIDAGVCAGSCHLLIIDLDGFKQVNDLHGHEAGDHVLRETAQRLLRAIGKDAVLARLGGDEFAAVVSGHRSDAAAVAARIVESLVAPVAYGAAALTIGASVGISSRGTGPNVSKTMLRQADAALYEAKSAGRSRVCCFVEPPARSAEWPPAAAEVRSAA